MQPYSMTAPAVQVVAAVPMTVITGKEPETLMYSVLITVGNSLFVENKLWEILAF